MKLKKCDYSSINYSMILVDIVINMWCCWLRINEYKTKYTYFYKSIEY